LARIIGSAEQIKAMRRDAEDDAIRRQYLQAQIANTQQAGKIAGAEEERAAAQFSQEQQLQNTRMLNVAAKSVAADPSTAAQWLPQLKQAGVLGADADLTKLPPEQLQGLAQKIAAQTDVVLQAYIRQNPQFAQIDQEHTNRLAQIQAQAEQARQLAAQQNSFDLNKLGAVQSGQLELERERGIQDRETQARQAMTGDPGTLVPVAAPATGQPVYQPRREAIGKPVPKTGATNDAKNTAWDTYVQARQGLNNSLASLDTGFAGSLGLGSGPIVGRLPATTATQQTAEGAVSAMAPVLKQIFRVAGEGTFTDKDQELLLRMVPTRADEPAAREAKFQNIDNIIRAKLGVDQSTPSNPAAPPAADNFDDTYSRLPSGATYVGPDGKTRQKR
jgi:hypothetical protein